MGHEASYYAIFVCRSCRYYICPVCCKEL